MLGFWVTPLSALGSCFSYWGDPLSEAALVETFFFLPLDYWRPAVDGDWRGTLVQPPAQPVIKTPAYSLLDTACPSSSTLPFLDEPLPESLLPRPLGEPAPVAATAASLAAGD